MLQGEAELPSLLQHAYTACQGHKCVCQPRALHLYRDLLLAAYAALPTATPGAPAPQDEAACAQHKGQLSDIVAGKAEPDEANLVYVGVTRAQVALFLNESLTRLMAGPAEPMVVRVS